MKSRRAYVVEVTTVHKWAKTSSTSPQIDESDFLRYINLLWYFMEEHAQMKLIRTFGLGRKQFPSWFPHQFQPSTLSFGLGDQLWNIRVRTQQRPTNRGKPQAEVSKQWVTIIQKDLKCPQIVALSPSLHQFSAMLSVSSLFLSRSLERIFAKALLKLS